MRRSLRWLALLACFGAAHLALAERGPEKAAILGVAVSYREGEWLTYPHFAIRHTGKRELQGPNNAPWKMTWYKFEITNGDERTTTEWSSGTGVIGPTDFTIGGHRYALELAYSVVANWKLAKDAWLGADEMVISPWADYEAAKAAATAASNAKHSKP